MNERSATVTGESKTHVGLPLYWLRKHELSESRVSANQKQIFRQNYHKLLNFQPGILHLNLGYQFIYRI